MTDRPTRQCGPGLQERTEAIGFAKVQFLELYAELVYGGPGDIRFQDEQGVIAVREVQKQRQLHADSHGMIPVNTQPVPRHIEDGTVSY